MTDTFKHYMLDTYSIDELREIAEHGCVSGCASTLIYYKDTNAIYDKYAEELHSVIESEADNFGEVPTYLVNALKEPLHVFKNSVVWFVAESYAFELINNSVEA
jgi:hypothetical protein